MALLQCSNAFSQSCLFGSRSFWQYVVPSAVLPLFLLVVKLPRAAVVWRFWTGKVGVKPLAALLPLRIQPGSSRDSYVLRVMALCGLMNEPGSLTC